MTKNGLWFLIKGSGYQCARARAEMWSSRLTSSMIERGNSYVVYHLAVFGVHKEEILLCFREPFTPCIMDVGNI